ncbi:transporter substrate-binding domain-containing protein [Kordiimonas sp. SCSIO 12610]|uniref:transporter substrate-binding domain-containing protein n=1 Tax=Kordiimonas sp. SCSIO 12610 TaxID=2829597 RepID=UPI00210B2E38|nr:transporter substrate-binding domain-containing protein [Kordiimonas sp. SCSIO 12610]UTW56092.1 transporter substrate-binding domain-containing protein [Kordiimonas sp. SCSIO 12610]
MPKIFHLTVMTAALLLMSAQSNIHSENILPNGQTDHKNTEIDIAASMVPNIFHPEKRGIYNDLVDLIFEDTPYTVNIDYQPVRRAQQTFLRKRAHCFFVSDKSSQADLGIENTGDDFIYSDTLNEAHIRIYTLASNPQISSIKDLEGKTIVADPGTGLGNALRDKIPTSATIVPSKTIENSIELLMLSRADALVAYDLDMNIHQNFNANALKPHTDLTLSLHTSYDSISCWDTPETQAFLNHVNHRFRALKQQGTLPLPLNAR